MKASAESFIAFFSYVRRNDEHDRGKLTYLRKLLEAELWAQTGKDLKIFQDNENIPWGVKWKERITNALDKSTFLIVIITPSYLESQSCRFEFNYYLKQESRLKRKLILPIIYIDTPRLKDTDDQIAVEISKRQWIDWQDLRFAALTSSKVTKKLESLAKQIRDLISDKELVVNAFGNESKLPPNSVLRPNTQVEIPQRYIPRTIQDAIEKEPQQITVIIRSTGDKERDKRRIRTIYGTLISFYGTDRFSIQFFENGKGYLVDFPDDTTRVCSELLNRLKKLMGEENWRVEEITFQ